MKKDSKTAPAISTMTIKENITHKDIGESFSVMVNPSHKRKFMQTKKALKSYIRTISYSSGRYIEISESRVRGKDVLTSTIIGKKLEGKMVGQKIGSGRSVSSKNKRLSGRINNLDVGGEFRLRSKVDSNLMNETDPKSMRQRVYSLKDRGLVNNGLTFSVSIVKNGVKIKRTA